MGMKTTYKQAATTIVNQVNKSVGEGQKPLDITDNILFLSTAIVSITSAILYLAEIIKEKK